MPLLAAVLVAKLGRMDAEDELGENMSPDEQIGGSWREYLWKPRDENEKNDLNGSISRMKLMMNDVEMTM